MSLHASGQQVSVASLFHPHWGCWSYITVLMSPSILSGKQ